MIEVRPVTMRNRNIGATILLLGLGLISATTVRAQSVADVDNAMHALDLRMRALNTARKKLSLLEHQSHDQEADAVRDIAEAESRVFTDGVKVFTVAFLLTGMKCPDDSHFTQKQFGLVVDSFVTTADAELALINGALGSVKAPPALVEATSIRDVIVDLRDFLKPFAAKAQL
jgi:hypothetical protein